MSNVPAIRRYAVESMAENGSLKREVILQITCTTRKDHFHDLLSRIQLCCEANQNQVGLSRMSPWLYVHKWVQTGHLSSRAFKESAGT